MTEPFASAVVSASPVLLLAGLVELEVHRRRVDELADRMLERMREKREAGLPAPGVHEAVGRVREAIAPAQLGAMGWGFFVLPQFIAMGIAMRWLAIPEQAEYGSGAGDAWVCMAALLLGMGWLVYFPMHKVTRSRKGAMLELHRILDGWGEDAGDDSGGAER